ncbi:hypothetical protein ACWT_6799 [Actinoplanes sp. SE50]|nr:hypothetical protein ACPL_6930 [Actinoplanes sp. SE50/110]ATO86214.1 hypothetical protein ACWT_6799 [Actinoplanes sp. SE50]SLM03628.1 hypothetical protein ACSP50_6921 [Actinoplanes sp. SE50/110]
MCRIEDLSTTDLRDLTRFFRSRSDDPSLAQLADWIEKHFQ